MGNVEISIAEISHIDLVTHIEITSKMASIPNLVEPFEVDYSLRAARWQTYFNGTSPASAKPERIVYLATLNGEGVGYLAGHLTTRYDLDAEIQSLYILKPFQRQGIGQILLSKFIAWLDTHNAYSLCVGIASENPYQAFYLKFGAQYLNPHWLVWNDTKTLKEKLHSMLYSSNPILF